MTGTPLLRISCLILSVAGFTAAQSDTVLSCLAAYLPYKLCPIVGAYPEYLDEYEFSPDKLTDQGHVTWDSDTSFTTVFSQSGRAVHKIETILGPDRYVRKFIRYKNASDTVNYAENYLYRNGLLYELNSDKTLAYFFYKNGRLDSIAETRQSEINHFKFEYDTDGLIHSTRVVVHDTSSGYRSESWQRLAYHFPDSITVKYTSIYPGHPIVNQYDTNTATVYLGNRRIDKLVERGSRLDPIQYTLIYRYSDDRTGIVRRAPGRPQKIGLPSRSFRTDLLGRLWVWTRRPDGNPR